jgi:hypothetical protein
VCQNFFKIFGFLASRFELACVLVCRNYVASFIVNANQRHHVNGFGRITVVYGDNLRSGKTKSCGCLRTLLPRPGGPPGAQIRGVRSLRRGADVFKICRRRKISTKAFAMCASPLDRSVFPAE